MCLASKRCSASQVISIKRSKADMDKATRLLIVIMALKIFGYSWMILIIGGLALSDMQLADPFTVRGLGQIFGMLFLLSPGISALYWANK